MMTAADAAYRWRHDKASLLSRGPEGMARAAFMFDLRTLADSVVEMTLAASGFRRRVGTATLNIQGDETGHTDERAAEFESFLAAQIYVAPDPARVLDTPDGAQATLTAFLDWCRRNGVVAVGGLPTLFDDESHGDALIVTLRDFYARSGAAFIALANRSQYPRRYFFDTPAHLRQSAQVAHSELVADALRPFVR